MNHQVEHHVHIQAARSEFAQPVNLEKQRLGHNRAERDDRGIEALQMSHLKDAAGRAGGFD